MELHWHPRLTSGSTWGLTVEEVIINRVVHVHVHVYNNMCNMIIINSWFFRRGKSDMFQYFGTIPYIYIYIYTSEFSGGKIYLRGTWEILKLPTIEVHSVDP